MDGNFGMFLASSFYLKGNEGMRELQLAQVIDIKSPPKPIHIKFSMIVMTKLELTLQLPDYKVFKLDTSSKETLPFPPCPFSRNTISPHQLPIHYPFSKAQQKKRKKKPRFSKLSRVSPISEVCGKFR